MIAIPAEQVLHIENHVFALHHLLNYRWHWLLRHVPRSQRYAYRLLRAATNRLWGIYTGTCKGQACQ